MKQLKKTILTLVALLAVTTGAWADETYTVAGINAVNSEEIKDNNYYDLSGRRVMQPTKGLFIVNGKKVVIE